MISWLSLLTLWIALPKSTRAASFLPFEEEEAIPIFHNERIVFPDDPTEHLHLRHLQTDTNSTTDPNDKIVSGTVVTDRNKYPFIAWPDVRNGGIFCGASLIFRDFLLSAAHCRGAFKGKTVFIGGTSVNGNNAQEAIVAVQEYIHPLYNSNNNRYDFMLVKLQRSTTVVSPIGWNTNSNTPSNSGTSSTVIGFGRTSPSSGLSASLREAQVRTTTSCQNVFTVDLSVHVCAGPTSSNESPCMGDSGGPLLVNGNIVGVVSFGSQNCDRGFPAVYGRVSAAQSWIQDTICSNSGAVNGNCELVANPITNTECFSGSNMVEVKDKGSILMSELQIGDYVKSSNVDTERETFSRVYSIAHLKRDVQVEYLQIYVDTAQQPLEISKQHLLYLGNNELVPAENVRIGDELVYQRKRHQVVRIQRVQRHGLYHPVTESGEIIVSGVRASTYAKLLQMDPSMEAFATHLILSPLRWACRYDFSICQNETYSEEGFSTTINFALQLALRISKQKFILQILWLVVSAPLFATLFFLNVPQTLSIVSLLVLLRAQHFLRRRFQAKACKQEIH